MATNTKPNIVIVMTDQQRADLRAGCGYPLDTMPYLDKFAADGTDFRRAYTPNPCCLPARVSMLTGRYPSCHNVRTNHNVHDAVCGEDLLDVLKRGGYRTALCGKNHSHKKPADFDFAERTGHLSGGGEVNETKEQIEFADFLKATRHMEMHMPSPGGVEVQHPYRNVDSAFKFIDGTDRENPFFIWLSFAEPHNPYQVPKPYFDMFPPEKLPPLRSCASDTYKKGDSFVWERKAWEKVLGDDIENRILRTRSNYHGMLRLIDDQFRRFVDGLDARGLRDNTVIVFLSDHGDLAGEYGLIRKGVGLPEVLTRVTMAWQGPGIVRSKVNNSEFVNLVDILPTVCDLIGEKIPFGCQGHSILPLLRGEKYPSGEYDVSYSECGYGGLYWNERDNLKVSDDRAITDGKTFAEMSSWTQSGQLRAVCKGDYKIQMDMMGEGWLYNLRNDPAELDNLWDKSEYADVKTEMLAALTAAILRAADPIPAPRNRYRTKLHPKGFWFDKDYIADDPGVPAGTISDFVANERTEEK